MTRRALTRIAAGLASVLWATNATLAVLDWLARVDIGGAGQYIAITTLCLVPTAGAAILHALPDTPDWVDLLTRVYRAGEHTAPAATPPWADELAARRRM